MSTARVILRSNLGTFDITDDLSMPLGADQGQSALVRLLQPEITVWVGDQRLGRIAPAGEPAFEAAGPLLLIGTVVGLMLLGHAILA